MPSPQPVLLGTNRFLLSWRDTARAARHLRWTQQNGVFEAHQVWRNIFLKNKFSSSVLYEGCIYGLDDDILVCLDAESGERKWKDGRFGYGQVLLASGHLVILAANGDLALVKANPVGFEEVARFLALQLARLERISPQIADGKILVLQLRRNGRCFDLGR